MSEVQSEPQPTLQERFIEPAGLMRTHGKVAEAIALLQQGLAECPDHPKLTLKLGEAYVHQGEKAAARECFEKIAAGGETREKSTAIQRLASMAVEDRDFEEARRYVDALLQIMPRHFGAYSLLGRIAFEEGDLDKTRKHFEHLAAIHPEGRKAKRVIEVFSREHDTVEALRQEIRDVLEDKIPGGKQPKPRPQSESAPKPQREKLETAMDYIELAKKLEGAGRIDTALALLTQAASLFPEDEHIVMKQISLYLLTGNMAGAKILVAWVLAKNPRHIDALQISVKIAEQEEDRASVLAHCRMLLEIDSTNQFVRRRLAVFGEIFPINNPQDFIEAAALFRKKGNREKALQILEEGSIKFPEDIAIIEAMALLYCDEQDFDRAEERFEKNLELQPGNPQMYFRLAKVSLQKGDRRTAKGHLQIALHRAPKFEAALRLLIEIFIEEGDAVQARRYLTWLISISPVASLPTIKRDFFTRLDALDEDASIIFTSYDPPSEQLHVTVLVPARRLIKNGQFVEAIALLKANLSHYQNNRYILKELAYCYLELGNLDQAYKCAADALVEFPYDRVTLRLLGMIEEAGGAYTRAERFFKKAHKIATGNVL